LYNFFIFIERLGGINEVLNNKDKFDKLGFYNKIIFKFLNEIVLRIDNKQLDVIGFTNIIKYIFNIDNTQLFDLLLSTGITKLKEPNRLSVSGFKKFRINNSNNNFSNWSVKLGFIGAKELHTWSGYNNFFNKIQTNINDINHIMGNKISRENVRTLMNTNSNSNSNSNFNSNLTNIEDTNNNFNLDVKTKYNKNDNNLDVKNNFVHLLNVLDMLKLNKDLLSELEDYLKLIGHFFTISKYGLSKKDHLKMVNVIKKEFKDLGLKSININSILDDVLNNENNSKLNLNKINESLSNANIEWSGARLDNNIGMKFAEDLILELIGLASRRDVNLDDDLLKIFKELIIMIYNFNDIDLIKLIENLSNDLRESFKDLINIESREIYRKRKLKRIQISSAAYNKDLNLYIKLFNKKCRSGLMKSITNLSNILLEQLPFKFKGIKGILHYAYAKNMEYLNNELTELNYDRISMNRVKKLKELDNSNMLNKIKYNLEGIKNMKIIFEDIKNKFMVNENGHGEINSELIDGKSKLNRMNKFDLEDNNPLSFTIRKILNDIEMSLDQKQISIEKATLEYDRNWFNMQGMNSVNVKNTLLHDIYKKVDKGINDILNNYISNNYKILKDIINNNSKISLRGSEGKSILIFLLLGNKNIINMCFKLENL